jgi:hypothetical protein
VVSKNKVHGKDKKKGSQLVIRIDKAERDAFVALCDRMDTSAAREIRRFMREQVAADTAKAASVDETAEAPIEAEAEAETEAETAAAVDPVAAPQESADAAVSEVAVEAVGDAKPTKKKKK